MFPQRTPRGSTHEVFAAGNPGTLTGAGNNTYLLDGDEPTLIDAGVGRLDHIDAIAAHLAGRPLARVLVTHGHPDHASGLPALRARWPRLEARKWLGAPETAGPTTSEPAWLPLHDAERVRAGDTWLTVVHTPGHSADHVCFWQSETGDLYLGDMMTATTTILVPPAAQGGSLRSYLDSLRRLADLQPVTGWPGHGSVISHPIERIEQYLDHRAVREQQVLACFRDNVNAVDDIVTRVYADTPEALWPAARLTVEALLEKLRDEGRLK